MMGERLLAPTGEARRVEERRRADEIFALPEYTLVRIGIRLTGGGRAVGPVWWRCDLGLAPTRKLGRTRHQREMDEAVSQWPVWEGQEWGFDVLASPVIPAAEAQVVVAVEPDAAPDPVVDVERDERGIWWVTIGGARVSSHSTSTAARTAARGHQR
ncbi:MAG TPA: hypothetical protein VMZ50_02135 [Phycisphaerae bacterium]|nr:hypothetical protein [Phycisphaerae bacterium]